MPKVIALQSRLDDVARVLKKRGYKVIDWYEASQPDTKVDAFLYTSYHSDITSSYTSLTEGYAASLGDGRPDQNADISDAYDDLGGSLSTAFGSVRPKLGRYPGAVMLNVVGMSPEEAADSLEERLEQSAHYRREQ